jgi:DNA-binding HxlR family transcriptional regulator
MKSRTETGCPVSYALDVVGDKWTLLILRDILIYDKKYYKDFLKSGEGIATNILADRLDLLVKTDILKKQVDPTNKTQAIYNPTQKALHLLPILGAMVSWGMKYNPNKNIPPNPFFKRFHANPEDTKKEIRAKIEKRISNS